MPGADNDCPCLGIIRGAVHRSEPSSSLSSKRWRWSVSGSSWRAPKKRAAEAEKTAAARSLHAGYLVYGAPYGNGHDRH
jgi:hypothetical protein